MTPARLASDPAAGLTLHNTNKLGKIVALRSAYSQPAQQTIRARHAVIDRVEQRAYLQEQQEEAPG